jgi:hypothetical protein
MASKRLVSLLRLRLVAYCEVPNNLKFVIADTKGLTDTWIDKVMSVLSGIIVGEEVVVFNFF